MCTGKCSKCIGITLFPLAVCAIVSNILLYFPNGQVLQLSEITDLVWFFHGILGAGILVILPAFMMLGAGGAGCCANRCGVFPWLYQSAPVSPLTWQSCEQPQTMILNKTIRKPVPDAPSVGPSWDFCFYGQTATGYIPFITRKLPQTGVKMLLSVILSVLGFAGGAYCVVISLLGLIWGPLCDTGDGEYLYPFRNDTLEDNYLFNQTTWNICKQPENIILWNIVLFSILLIIGVIEAILCFIQVINGLTGFICGTCMRRRKGRHQDT
ncbi:transmembrane 4 L6 family member 1-like isoform X2 [Parus major]|uniref:transmembrane 4 L6 family member 1-like isoform X2 n=1 Tax=Parus major TaxID=9157 RepID=UPI00144417BE|nr:transmembrane 4 L6 family member 1-like isoform X2 [Parus major]